MKYCKSCETWKPLDEFSNDNTRKDGKRTQCKECRRVPHLKGRREAQRMCEARATAGEQVKLCSCCEQCKPLEEFYESPRHRNGKRSWCKACQSEYYQEHREQAAAKWKIRYAIRREEIIQYRRNYYVMNREHENKRNRRYYHNNRIEIGLKNQEYKQRFPQVKKAAEQRRLARKRQLPHRFTSEDWKRAVAYFGGRCAVCGRLPDESCTLAADHWIPLVSPDCPGTVPENVVPLCHGVSGCNNEKQDLYPQKWLERKLGKAEANRKLLEIETFLSWVQK